MQVFKFHRDYLPQVNTQHLNLVYNQEVYLPYIQRKFSISNFEKQIHEKENNFPKENRKILVDALTQQYSKVKNNSRILEKIQLLNSEETFTVTTGHQLSLFTGPMYFVVKILHAIKLSEKLNERFPENTFLPVYWMASEDHDFEEIQSMNLFNRKFTWESDQKGPVGRFNLEGFEEVKNQIKEMFKNHPDAEINDLLDAYSGENLTEATRNLVHFLFEKYGLIVIDGDDKNLKKIFSPIIKRELETSFSFKEVEKTDIQLKRDGAKIQVHAREINLFYLLDGLRNRIIKNGENYEVEGVGTFTKEEILAELEHYPERFSPNVILRPLYQEMILPNLAYIGGAGEISYWLQLKGVFDAVDCVFPMIGIRNSVLWIDAGTSKKMNKIDLKLEDLFKNKDLLKKEFVQSHDNGTLDFSNLEKNFSDLEEELTSTVLGVDETLTSFASAENSRLEKQLEALKAKLIKISKGKHDTSLKQIDQIIDKLFPLSNLQERVSNFFTFSPDGGYNAKLDLMYRNIDSEEKDLIIIQEKDYK